MPPEARAASCAPTRFDRVAETLAERATPLFVKELRQALRGRYLKVTLSIAVALTTLAAVIVLGIVVPLKIDELRAYAGVILFGATFGATAFVATFFVPFAAFSSMNAEADENTLEFLQLSNLSPLAIASGKLVSASLQAALVCATAMPFAVVAWHMGGIPPSLLVLAPLFTMIGAACFSAIAIALSTLSRVRWVRIVLMVLFGFFLFNVGQYMLFLGAVAGAAVFLPGAGGMLSGAMTFGVSAVAALGFLAVALAFAANMLAHREESGSTPLRRVTSILALLGAIATLLVTLAGSGGAEAVGLATTALVVTFPALAWCCTEAEALPLGPRARPPRPGLSGWLALPHLAGGGRGALLATLTCVGIGLAGALGAALARGGWSEDASRPLGVAAYAWLYLLLPSVVFSPWSGRTAVRALARVGVFAFPWVAFLGTSLLKALITGPTPDAFENPANPFHMLSRLDARGAPVGLGGWAVLGFFLLLTLALNAWRMARGVLEVRRAMRARDARERPEAAV